MPEKSNHKPLQHISMEERCTAFVLPVLLIVIDYISIVAAENLAYQIRRYMPPIANPEFHIPSVYLYIIVPTVFLCFLHSSNSHIRSIPFWKMAQNVFWGILYAILTLTMLMYFGKMGNGVSRLFVGMTGVLSFVFILTVRYWFKKYINHQKLFQVPVVFIGAGHTAELVLKSFDHDSGFGYKVLGFIDDHPISKTLAGNFSILGGFADAERVIDKLGVQTVIITVPGLSAEKQVKLINRIQPHVKHISFVPNLIGTPMGSIEIESLVDEKILLIKVKNNLAHWYNRAMKRAFDLVASLLAMLIVIPIGLILGGLIYIDSPGPVIFAHKRIGRYGKTFPCYKFRSMVLNAESVLTEYLSSHPDAMVEWNRDFKLKKDPRITRIGAFLRKTSLDELPQLFNVIKGEMSLVGPRPIVEEEIIRYGEYIQDFYLVPPGITGMWQVNGRSDTTYEERVQMDTWYVRNWSVWIDMVYLLKTVKVVFQQKGAY